MKRVFIVLFLFLFCVSNVYAFKIANEEIQIRIDSSGFVTISEKYLINFDSPFELEDFKKEATENASSLLHWQVDLPWFYPRMGTEADFSSVYISFDEKERALYLDYSIDSVFANEVSQMGRSSRWEIPANNLGDFMNQGLLVIPENTKIIIELPSNANVSKKDLPSQALIEGNNKIILSGITTNAVNLIYELEKPIAPLNLFEIIQNFSSSNLFVIIVLFVVIFGVIYWKRHDIENNIEEYIVAHSEFSSQEAEDIEVQE